MTGGQKGNVASAGDQRSRGKSFACTRSFDEHNSACARMNVNMNYCFRVKKGLK